MKKTVYFAIDCSGSMYGSRADAVNVAMRKVVDEAIPEIKAQKAADLELSFKVVGFSSDFVGGVKELMPKTPLDDFNNWDDLDASLFNGGTPTGAALASIVEELEGGNHGEPEANTAAPAIILISDGLPTGDSPSYEEVMAWAEKGSPVERRIFRKSLRVALGISADDDGRNSLKQFGKVSRKMEDAGILPYYDCSESYVNRIVEILVSATINASI